MHYVYVLHSDRLGKYYVRRTENMSKRLEDHNAGRSTYTKRGRPRVLVCEERFEEKADAVAREIEIKKRKSRRYIEKVGSERPQCRFQFLSEIFAGVEHDRRSPFEHISFCGINTAFLFLSIL